MAKRDNHYEAAFEGYLREHGVPYVAVDEAKRARLGHASLKSLDFIVSPAAAGRRWLVDVKGRRFPAGRRRQFWRNWSTGDDLQSLARWQELFGPPFVSLLVFAYEVAEDVSPLPPEALYAFRQRLYAFVGIRLDHYTSAARIISPKWGTLSMPAERFRELARPLREFLAEEGGVERVSAIRSQESAVSDQR